MRVILPFLLILLVLCGRGVAAICPRCGQNHLPEPPKKEEPKEKTKETEKEKEKEPDEVLLSVSRERFQTSSLEIADACDKILDR